MGQDGSVVKELAKDTLSFFTTVYWLALMSTEPPSSLYLEWRIKQLECEANDPSLSSAKIYNALLPGPL
jgi:hypothetical protein